MKRWIYGLAACALMVLFVWLWPPGTWLVPDCQLDASFSDWRGRAHVTDPEGDAEAGHDFKNISWATNENDSRLYFMIERDSPEPATIPMEFRIYMDINGNGKYTNRVDKYAQISYLPRNQVRGDVYVYLYAMSGELKGRYNGIWGEGTGEGASRFEFAIPMEDLGLYPGQAMRYYLSDVSNRYDRLPDQGDIQWAPFPLVPKSRTAIAITCLVWFGITVFFYKHRLMFFYYVWGSVGLCCVMVLLFCASFVEYRMEYLTTLFLHNTLGYLDIVTYVFDKAPGTLLVLIKIDTSWTTIDIDIENSGLVEMCIIFSLIVFYPVHNWRKRIGYALSGVVGVYLINLLRLAIVIVLIHWGGRNMSFIAHTLFGRLVFFILIVALYWQLITKPSLEKIKRNVQND